MLETLPLFSGTGLSDTVIIGLIVASYCTSAFTAAFGIGGGVALLALMSSFVPVATLIPVHGVIQLGSNVGRAHHLRAHILWSFLVTFVIGTIIGIAIGSQVVISLPDVFLKICLALFLLYIIWGPKPKRLKGGPIMVALMGGVTAFGAMFLGATGPLIAAVVSGQSSDRQTVVATHATAMSIQHGFKILAFGLVGFAYHSWIALMICMIMSGYVGTLTGARALRHMDESLFRKIFRIVLTALALIMLLKAARDLL
ncbi:Uncharacterized membrane protein YfcA [Cohaesibacter sp. ES.047]|uniref:sulfite exporter TauE/SafE family protein n=1 Tax=Cohaesibacter sp. ES.047 TaxID=1798205 RepID=UPI000BB8F8D9|nr:sulfite exporter TauE/SafE family protein [Cohaesibacter sp. ES.047]SNY90842.1 Uncharacterized membrane protein YfcA [Cohaesibacter sp. ES.047]